MPRIKRALGEGFASLAARSGKGSGTGSTDKIRASGKYRCALRNAADCPGAVIISMEISSESPVRIKVTVYRFSCDLVSTSVRLPSDGRSKDVFNVVAPQA